MVFYRLARTAVLTRGAILCARGLFSMRVITLLAAVLLITVGACASRARDAEEAVERGLSLGRKGSYDEAIEEFNKAIAFKPDHAEAYWHRGVMFQLGGEFKKALADFDKAISLDPDDHLFYVDRGNVYGDMGQQARAIKEYDQALRLNPKSRLSYYNRGRAHLVTRDYVKAIHDLDKALSGPAYLPAHMVRGLAYVKMGKYDKAIDDYTAAIKRDPVFAKAHFGRGIALRKNGQYASAIQDFNRALQLSPVDPNVYYQRALTEWEAGLRKRALRDFNKTIELNKTHFMAHYDRGMLRFDDKAYEEAKQDFVKANEIRPRDAYVSIMLHLIEWRKPGGGKSANTALAVFRRSLNDEEWSTNLVRMLLGEITPEQCLGEAHDEDAKEMKRRQCETYYYAGQSYLLRGDIARARRMFEQCRATGVQDLAEYLSATIELARLQDSGAETTSSD